MGGGKKIQNLEIEAEVHKRVAQIETITGRMATRRQIMEIGKEFVNDKFKSSKGWASKFQLRRKNFLGYRKQRCSFLAQELLDKAKRIPFDKEQVIKALELVPKKSWWYFKTNFEEK